MIPQKKKKISDRHLFIGVLRWGPIFLTFDTCRTFYGEVYAGYIFVFGLDIHIFFLYIICVAYHLSLLHTSS